MSSHFEPTHNAYLRAWQEAFDTGDPSGLGPFFAADYNGVFSTGPGTSVSVDANVAIAGLADSVRAMRGATSEVRRRIVGRRGDDAVCVFYVRTVAAEGGTSEAFVTENWARSGGEDAWLLQREAVEHGVTTEATGSDPVVS